MFVTENQFSRNAASPKAVTLSAQCYRFTSYDGNRVTITSTALAHVICVLVYGRACDSLLVLHCQLVYADTTVWMRRNMEVRPRAPVLFQSAGSANPRACSPVPFLDWFWSPAAQTMRTLNNDD